MAAGSSNQVYPAGAGIMPNGMDTSLPVTGFPYITTTPLAANAAPVSTPWIWAGFAGIEIILQADQDSANGGLSIEFSSDRQSVLPGGTPLTYLASSGRVRRGFGAQGPWARVKYQNGATAQGSFYFAVKASADNIQTTTSSLNQNVTATATGHITIGVIQSPDTTGAYGTVGRHSTGIDTYLLNPPDVSALATATNQATANTSLANLATSLSNVYTRQADGNQKVQVVNFPATQTVGGTVSISNLPTTQAVSGSFWPTAANAPESARLSDGTNFYDARQIRPLTAATDTVLIGNAAIPVTGSFWATAAGSPESVRLTDGTSFYDARQTRALTSSDIVTIANPTTTVSLSPATLTTITTTTQPVSAASLPLPSGAAQEHITATSYHAARLTDGTSFFDPRQIRALTSADQVTVAALPLASGASTSALQTSGNATLTAISGQLPATIGQKTSSASTSVVIASDQTIPVSIASGAAVTATNTPSVNLYKNLNTYGGVLVPSSAGKVITGYEIAAVNGNLMILLYNTTTAPTAATGYYDWITVRQSTTVQTDSLNLSGFASGIGLLVCDMSEGSTTTLTPTTSSSSKYARITLRTR